jgi:F0F1-type ATP synthase alpha subunit
MMTSEISKFEQRFLEHLKTRHPEILSNIRIQGQLSKETDEKLKAVLEEFIPTAGLQMRA